MSDDVLDRLITEVDLDGLIRLIDGRCSQRDWEGLLRLRDRCTAATQQTGRQLWPAATLAEYRLALLAPAEWSARVLDGEAGRFAIGPLSEVAAVGHTWADLVRWLPPTPLALFVAHECAVRGEVVDPASVDGLPPVLDIPATPRSWEPDYPVSTYSDTGAEHPEPASGPVGETVAVRPSAPHPSQVVDDPEVEYAVRELLDAWTASSTGRAEVVCVEGDAVDALGALGVTSARIVEIDRTEAISRLAWAGASGGAHGRRRGMALGRYSTWWLVSAIGDLGWPPDDDDIIDLLDELRWYRWDAHEPAGGWRLQLVIENPAETVAWAINASDAA